MTKSCVSTGHAPMAGRLANRHGSCCGGPPGIDCSDYGVTVWDRVSQETQITVMPCGCVMRDLDD